MHDFGVKNENWNFRLISGNTSTNLKLRNILEYNWAELSGKIVNFLFKNGVATKNQWR